MKDDFDFNKLPGKTVFSGRRRSVTRKSGFTSHMDSTGGEFKSLRLKSFLIPAGRSVRYKLEFPIQTKGKFVGFGAWFCSSNEMEVTVEGDVAGSLLLQQHEYPNWSKLGSMWTCVKQSKFVILDFKAIVDTQFSVYGIGGGNVRHRHLDGSRAALLKNMHQFCPESLFYEDNCVIINNSKEYTSKCSEIFIINLKSCNRCARFLPVNFLDERATLSFSNHCVAEHRRPCRHKGFGILKDIGNNDRIKKLEYGFQLECRFCKKFEVNAAHNPMRTSAQMKEDGARRRFFELLLTELYEGSSQLKYREIHKSELSDDVFERFKGQCFNCGKVFKLKKEMNLDHTRPLALLWPLDGTATSLCKDCNSSKRDQPPAEYYKPYQLKELANICGLSLDELKNPYPNMNAIKLLQEKIEWFFTDFLSRPEMIEVRDGKLTGELLIKALQKTLNRCEAGAPFDISKLYDRYRES